MSTTAKVKEIQGVKPYEGQHGTTYYFTLAMDNGDSGQIGKKSQDAIKIGDQLTYTLESTQYGNKIKEINQNGFGGGFRKSFEPKSDNSFALSYAKDLVIEQMRLGKTGDADSKQLATAICSIGNIFKQWLDENK